MTEAKNLYQNRRSVYALGKNLPISEQEVLEIIDNAVKYSPSAFNSQTAHAVVLLGENHQKLWDITFGELEKLLPNKEAKAATKGKIDSFAAALWNNFILRRSRCSERSSRTISIIC